VTGRGGAALRGRVPALALAAALACAGCFTFGAPPPPGEPYLRPAVQRMGQHQVVGNAVVASYAGAAITIEPLTPDVLDALHQNRPGIVNPLKGLPGDGKAPAPLAFRVTIRNRGRQPVQVEASQFLLRDQDEGRAKPLEYQDFYQLLSELPDADQRLRSVQATTYSTFVTVMPGQERDGFVYFPPIGPEARLYVLELNSLYVGTREVPILSEFEVVRPKGSPAPRR
jgi:hypothetical protein